MAIFFEFNVMIARKAEIDDKYPGALAQFRVDWLVKPPERWCEDEHLLAFSSMGNYYDQVLSSLESHGIDVLTTGEDEPPERVLSRCSWIECDVHTRDQRLVPKGDTSSCLVRYWLKGSEPGETVPFGRRKHQP